MVRPLVYVTKGEGLTSKKPGVMLPCLSQLGIDDGHTVALVGVQGVVVLMVRLSLVESAQGFYHRDDGLIPQLLCPANGCFKEILLLLILVVEGRAVLGAGVRSLTIPAGGVVRRKEDIKYGFGRNDGLIELDLDHLNVAGGTRTDFAVGGVIDVSTGVATDTSGYSFKLAVYGVDAPEAPAANDKTLHTSCNPTGVTLIPSARAHDTIGA